MKNKNVLTHTAYKNAASFEYSAHSAPEVHSAHLTDSIHSALSIHSAHKNKENAFKGGVKLYSKTARTFSFTPCNRLPARFRKHSPIHAASVRLLCALFATALMFFAVSCGGGGGGGGGGSVSLGGGGGNASSSGSGRTHTTTVSFNKNNPLNITQSDGVKSLDWHSIELTIYKDGVPQTYHIDSTSSIDISVKSGSQLYATAVFHTADGDYTATSDTLTVGPGKNQLTLHINYKIEFINPNPDDTNVIMPGNLPVTYNSRGIPLPVPSYATPTKKFTAWCFDAELTQLCTTLKGVTGNKKLYARFDDTGTPPTTCTVTYHLPVSLTDEERALIILPTAANIITEYETTLAPPTITNGDPTITFIGWYTDDAHTNPITTISALTTGTIDLYGKFDVTYHDYTLNFANSSTIPGSVASSITLPNTTTFNKKDGPETAVTNLSFTTPTGVKSLDFDGWYFDSALTQAYSEAALKQKGANVTLYAKYTLKYDITYAIDPALTGIPANAITLQPTLPDEFTYSVATSVPDPQTSNQTIPRYTFTGWYFDSGLTQAYSEDALKQKTAAVTLYGKFSQEKVFDANTYAVNSTFEVDTPEQLNQIATLVKNGSDFTDKTVKLNGSLDLTSLSPSFGGLGDGTTSKKFNGTFDGNGNTVTVSITGSNGNNSAAGFIHALGSSGKVENLIVAGTVNGNGAFNCGGIVGENSGTVENCGNNATVSNSGTQNTAGVVGTNDIGATITSCYNHGDVTGSYNTTTGNNSQAKTGGICGYNYGTIKHAYNTGTVTSNGTHTGNFTAGIAACTTGGTITYCYNGGGIIKGAGNGGYICAYLNNDANVDIMFITDEAFLGSSQTIDFYPGYHNALPAGGYTTQILRDIESTALEAFFHNAEDYWNNGSNDGDYLILVNAPY